MTIVRMDPFRELAAMGERMNRLFGDFSGRRSEDDVMTRGDWMPPVDIYQTADQSIVMKVELPGIAREDIDLRIDNSTLTIRGERKRESAVKDEQYHRVERVYGAFSRSFSIPQTVNAEAVHAEFKDGVLTVTLPAREEARPRQVHVQVAG
jgi:HSP20 family protein